MLCSYLLVAAFIAGSYASVVSQTPTCFVCPPEDLAGFPLEFKDEASDPIFCSYPSSPGQDPNIFFCKYSKTVGVLVEDHDEGLCPPTAVNNCVGGRRKRDALPRSPRPCRPEARNPKSDVLRTRNKLGALKRRERD